MGSVQSGQESFARTSLHRINQGDDLRLRIDEMVGHHNDLLVYDNDRVKVVEYEKPGEEEGIKKERARNPCV